ncbi:methyltransferase [Microbulbifer sp. TRSA001]|uniref:methyltransferase n=1 Tax=Microbulbifer sp. TRSA001 TaxID=3243381 RepID=UPI0040394C84
MSNNKTHKITPPTVADSPMWDRLMGNYNFACLMVSAQLDITGLIEQGYDTCKSLSQKLQLSDKGMRFFLLVLSHLGYICYDNHRLKNTELSQSYLSKDSLYYWGEVLLDPFHIYNVNHLDKKILTSLEREYELECKGRSVTDMWQNNDMDSESAAAFTHLMHSQGFASAVTAVSNGIFAEVQCLMDAGGGSGAIALPFCDSYPKRKAVLFDLTPVCAVASEYVQNFGKKEQVRIVPGDFFTGSWPEGCDGICLSNILHDWRPETCQFLIDKAFAFLPNGGHLFIHDMLLDETRLTPSLFCFHLFMNHGSQLYSTDELNEMLEKAGFEDTQCRRALGYFFVVSARKPQVS